MTLNINQLSKDILSEELHIIAPNYIKGAISTEEQDKIIDGISKDLEITHKEALAGTMLLFLKGAASSGTPSTLSVDLKSGKTIAKKEHSRCISLSNRKLLYKKIS